MEDGKRPVAPGAGGDAETRLLAYALTAGAALAVGAQPATADTIKTTVNQPIASGSSYDLDLNNDSITDFVLTNGLSALPAPYDTLGVLQLAGQNPANGVFGIPGGFKGKPIPFGIGIPIGSASVTLPRDFGTVGWDAFMPNNAILAAAGSTAGSLVGKAPGQAYPFFLRFDVSGNTHYGWTRLSAEFEAPYTLDAKLVDFAYENVAGEPVHMPGPVPEPGTLGLLALGVAGLAVLRKRRKTG